MATAEELLRSTIIQPNPEGHIVVGGDRFITVPENLKRLGVEHDHNMETVTFDCPRYWDNRDMSKMAIYVNYQLSNKYADRYPVDNVRVDDDVMHFDWTISKNVTQVAGSVSFLICVMATDSEGNEERHWNSEICQDCFVSNGMEAEDHPALEYPDEVTQLLLRMSTVEQINVQAEEMRALHDDVVDVAATAEETKNQAIDASNYIKNTYANAVKGSASGSVVRINDVSPIEHEIKCRVHGKNLLNDSKFKIETRTYNGVSCTANNDGSYTLSGTNNSSSFATFGSNRTTNYEDEPLYPSGTYTPAPGVTVVCRDEVTRKETNYQQTFEAVNPFRVMGWYCYVSPNTSVLGGSYVKLPTTIFPQLEEGSIATEYEPYIDPTTVEVVASGKNFWHSRKINYPQTVSGVTINYDPEHQVYTFNGTSTSPGDIYVVPNGTHIMRINPGETWTLQVDILGGTIDGEASHINKISPLVNTSAYTNTIHANADSGYVTKTYTESADVTKMYFYVYKSGLVFNNFKVRVQFEMKNTPTTFEKSRGVMTGTVTNSDGVVSGITSLTPNMVIKTDTPGATIEAEYNVDTMKFLNGVITDDRIQESVNNWLDDSTILPDVIAEQVAVQIDPAVENLFDDHPELFVLSDDSVKQWLDEHPEATTTVQDGAITPIKLSADLMKYVGIEGVTPGKSVSMTFELGDSYRCWESDIGNYTIPYGTNVFGIEMTESMFNNMMSADIFTATVELTYEHNETLEIRNETITLNKTDFRYEKHTFEFALGPGSAVVTLPSPPDGYCVLSMSSNVSFTYNELPTVETLYVTPQMFGAKGDGVTDDTAAIQAAIDSGKQVHLPKGTYATTLPLVISKQHTQISGEAATVVYSGTESAVKVMHWNITLRMHQIQAPNGTALEIDGSGTSGVEECNIHVERLYRCVTGLHVHTNANPICNNIFRIDRILCTDIGVLVWVDASFITENYYYLGKVSGGNVGVYLRGTSTASAWTNYFIKASFEGTNSTLADQTERTANLPYTCAIYLESAGGCRFYGIRTAESYGQMMLSMNGVCDKNLIELSNVDIQKVDISGLTDSATSTFNVLRSLGGMVIAGGYHCGPEALISAKLGIVYDPKYYIGGACNLHKDSFVDNIIRQRPSDGRIHTSFECWYANINGLTFTLGELFTEHWSPVRGHPLVFYFTNSGSGGGIKLQDVNGQEIFDNTDYHLGNSTVVVQWSGYDAKNKRHLWEVKKIDSESNFEPHAYIENGVLVIK